MKKRVFIPLVIIFSLFLVFGLFLNIGHIAYNIDLKNDITKGVYLSKSETTFNGDNTISVTFVNTTKYDYKDEVVHLIYLDNQGDPVGFSYSNQITISLDAKERKTVIFDSMDWTYNEHYTINACVQNSNNEEWNRLSSAKDIENMNDYMKIVKYVGIVFTSLFVVLDFVVIVAYIRSNKKLKSNNN